MRYFRQITMGSLDTLTVETVKGGRFFPFLPRLSVRMTCSEESLENFCGLSGFLLSIGGLGVITLALLVLGLPSISRDLHRSLVCISLNPCSSGIIPTFNESIREHPFL